MSVLDFKPKYFAQRDDGNWVLRGDIALNGPEGRSHIGLRKVISEAKKIEDAGGLVVAEPNMLESSISMTSLNYLSNALAKRETS